ATTSPRQVSPRRACTCPSATPRTTISRSVTTPKRLPSVMMTPAAEKPRSRNPVSREDSGRWQAATRAILTSVSGTAVAEEIGTLVAQLKGWLAEVGPALLYQAPSPGEWTVMGALAHRVGFPRHWPAVIRR